MFAPSFKKRFFNIINMIFLILNKLKRHPKELPLITIKALKLEKVEEKVKKACQIIKVIIFILT